MFVKRMAETTLVSWQIILNVADLQNVWDSLLKESDIVLSQNRDFVQRIWPRSGMDVGRFDKGTVQHLA